MKVLILILSLFCCYAMADDSIPPAVKAFEKQGIKIIRQVKIRARSLKDSVRSIHLNGAAH